MKGDWFSCTIGQKTVYGRTPDEVRQRAETVKAGGTISGPQPPWVSGQARPSVASHENLAFSPPMLTSADCFGYRKRPTAPPRRPAAEKPATSRPAADLCGMGDGYEIDCGVLRRRSPFN